MPDEQAVTTQLQAEISAKTAAAVQDTGFGKEFDAEVEAAIARDSAADKPTEPAAPSAPAAPAAKPKADAKPAEIVPDIPEALLGEKKKAAGETVGDPQTEADREKFIKEQTAGLSTKAADRFRAIEKMKHEAEQRAIAAERTAKELREAQAKAVQPDNSELEKYKKQVEELDSVVQRANLAEHPKFKAHYDGQREKEIALAKTYVGADKAAEVEALLSLPETAQRNRRLNEIIEELEPIEAGKFQSAVDRADRLAAEKAAQLADWKTNKIKMQELSQAEQQQTAQQRAETIDRAIKTVLPRFTDDEKGIELFRKVDGNEEWNNAVENRIQQVKNLTAKELGRDEIAEMAAWAMSGAEYRKLFLTQRVLVSKLKAEIAAMKGGEPDLGQSGASAPDEEKGSMIDVVSRAAQKMGAVR